MKYLSSQRGYTLLFAVLTSSLVLGVAAFILSISRKQLQLASTARESMHAFYAADSGIECMVNDPQSYTLNNPDGTVSTNYSFICNGISVQRLYSLVPNETYIDSNNVPHAAHGTTVRLNFLPACAIVKLYVYTDNATGKKYNIIQSRGYNLCTAALAPDSTPKIVERALQISYQY